MTLPPHARTAVGAVCTASVVYSTDTDNPLGYFLFVILAAMAELEATQLEQACGVAGPRARRAGSLHAAPGWAAGSRL
jgi:hypothetical protein